jgi:hypothetical protein
MISVPDFSHADAQSYTQLDSIGHFGTSHGVCPGTDEHDFYGVLQGFLLRRQRSCSDTAKR